MADVAMDESEARLAAAVERLYTVFRSYRKPPLEMCFDMGVPADGPRVWEKRLVDYSPAELESLCRHSLCQFVLHKSDLMEQTRRFKFWLPRLVHEMVAHDPKTGSAKSGYATEDWFISHHLLRGRWMGWPKPEREAVGQLCEAWLAACRAFAPTSLGWECRPASRDAQAAMEFATEIGLDLTHQLVTAAREPRPSDVRALWEIVSGFLPDFARRKNLGDDQDPAVPARRNLLRWMLDGTTLESLERAFFLYSDQNEAVARCLSEVVERLTVLQSSWESDSRGIPAWLAHEEGGTPRKEHAAD